MPNRAGWVSLFEPMDSIRGSLAHFFLEVLFLYLLG